MRPQQEADSPETVTENEREAKQLWPFLASYYIQQGQRPLFMAAPTTVQALPHVPPTPVLSASNLFSKYTKSVGTAGNYYFGNTVGNQHPLSAWNHRVKETSTSPLLQDLDQGKVKIIGMISFQMFFQLPLFPSVQRSIKKSILLFGAQSVKDNTNSKLTILHNEV